MKRRKAGKRAQAKPPPPAREKGRAGAVANCKLGAQARRLLGKHYASKYPTMRRG